MEVPRKDEGFQLSKNHTHIPPCTKFNHGCAAAWGHRLWKPHYAGKSPFPCYFTQKHPPLTQTCKVWLNLHKAPGNPIFLFSPFCGWRSCTPHLEEPEQGVTSRGITFQIWASES